KGGHLQQWSAQGRRRQRHGNAPPRARLEGDLSTSPQRAGRRAGECRSRLHRQSRREMPGGEYVLTDRSERKKLRRDRRQQREDAPDRTASTKRIGNGGAGPLSPPNSLSPQTPATSTPAIAPASPPMASQPLRLYSLSCLLNSSFDANTLMVNGICGT